MINLKNCSEGKELYDHLSGLVTPTEALKMIIGNNTEIIEEFKRILIADIKDTIPVVFKGDDTPLIKLSDVINLIQEKEE